MKAFSAELAEEDEQKMKALDIMLGISKTKRKANEDWVLKFGHQLQAGANWNLMECLPPRRLRLLQPGEEREFQLQAIPAGGQVRRSIIVPEDGDCFYEFPRKWVAGQRQHH